MYGAEVLIDSETVSFLGHGWFVGHREVGMHQKSVIDGLPVRTAPICVNPEEIYWAFMARRFWVFVYTVAFAAFAVLALLAAIAAIMGWGDLTTRVLETAGFAFMAWTTRDLLKKKIAPDAGK